MCMLYVKPENFTMPQDYLDSLKRKNGDGLAIYNKATGEVFKTLNYTEGFKYMNDNHDNELVVHFRFGTSGEETLDQLHGFSVCNDEYYLFHNGVLSTIRGDFKTGKSDTQVLVNIYRDEPVEKLVEYLEKHEKRSRFLLVNKATKEYIIPKCADWDGDSTIDGTHIIFSNSYAIDYRYLDKGLRYTNTVSTTPSHTTYRSSGYYNQLWKDFYEDQEASDLLEDEDNDEIDSRATVDILEAIWKGDKAKAINLIKLYPTAAYTMMYDMMEQKDIALPF